MAVVFTASELEIRGYRWRNADLSYQEIVYLNSYYENMCKIIPFYRTKYVQFWILVLVVCNQMKIGKKLLWSWLIDCIYP